MRLVSMILTVVLLLTGCVTEIDTQNVQTAYDGGVAVQEERHIAQPEFVKGGQHNNSQEYRAYFRVYTATDGVSTVSIQTNIYSDELGGEIWERVTGDLQAISEAVQAEIGSHTIYVVEELIAGRIHQTGDRVYCTAEDVVSGGYREALINAALGLGDMWKGIGLAGYVFGDAADEADLRAYYEQADEECMDILSLFPAYFIDAFASEEEMFIARETAKSFAGYIIEQYGMETLLEENGIAYKQEWLNALGVERVYHDAYAESLSGYHYSFSAEYPLIVTTSRGDIIYIKPLPEDIEKPKHIWDFLYLSKKGMEEVLRSIEREAPEYLQVILDNYDHPIHYYFKTGRGPSTTETLDTIYLTYGGAFLHETMHVIIPRVTSRRTRWEYEAMANYLPFTFSPFTVKRDDIVNLSIFTELFRDAEESDDAWAKHCVRAGEIYLKYADMPNSPKDIDFTIYYISTVEASLRYPQAESQLLPILYCSSNLSYEEAFVFASYLIEKFSLSHFLRYCFEDISFEEIFGMEYEEAKTEWLECFIK